MITKGSYRKCVGIFALDRTAAKLAPVKAASGYSVEIAKAPRVEVMGPHVPSTKRKLDYLINPKGENGKN